MTKKDNSSKNSTLIDNALQISAELEQTVEEMIQSNKQDVSDHWDEAISDIQYVPVDNGEIRVVHANPESPVGQRPIVFVPGWGTTIKTFKDFYGILKGKVELFYVETREKGSSKITIRKADMSIHQKAKDIQNIINHFELNKRDFVLMAPCWGGTIILQGLLDKTITAPTYVVFDPMHYFWYNNFFMRYFVPVLPASVVYLMKPILKFFALRGMKAKVQRQRTETLIDAAAPRKWKKAALANLDLELFGKLSAIEEEVFVFNGTTDKIHDQQDYPLMAQEIPNGRFFYMKTDESKREYLMGTIALEFSKVSQKQGVPSTLKPFEKMLK
ncbi:MAG: hypothetical protein GF308_17660 [Candidatus Heimdallarchaeota archaeon]|nr:hypothetical protein [Candidatus Heimdallarchaeota archaeon]